MPESVFWIGIVWSLGFGIFLGALTERHIWSKTRYRR